MEHIVQFGICIDDDAIKKNIENNVQRQVENEIKEDCIRTITGKNDYVSTYEYRNKLLELINNTTNEFLESHKDEIIKEASEKLADRLLRTKAVKEAVETTLNSLL